MGRKRKPILWALMAMAVTGAVVAAALAGGCQSSGTGTGTSPPAATEGGETMEGAAGGGAGGAAAGKSATVSITKFTFSPSSVTVAEGGKVTWKNNDSVEHTVTADDDSFDVTLQSGESGSQTFDKAGEYSYVCAFHPSMKGRVVVK